MSSRRKLFAVPIAPALQPAEDPFADTPRARDIEASCLEVPIRVLGRLAAGGSDCQSQEGGQFEEDGTTMLLFPRGAVIRLTRQVECGRELMLINKRTNRYAHCRVTNLRATSDVNYVEIEFTHSIPDFWGMSFPKDAVSALSTIAAFALPVPAELPSPVRTEDAARAPAKALAAAAGTAATSSGNAASSAACDGAVTIIKSRPHPPADADKVAAPPQFFELRPMECVPVCEPVADSVEPPPAGRGDDAPVAPLKKWEAISVAAPRRKRNRLRAGAAVALCAIVLGYRFYSPAEAALPLVPQVADSRDSDGSQSAGAERRAVDATNASDSTVPPGAILVSADAPEIESVETPSQRVVLVSKMNLAVPGPTGSPHAAPELSTVAGGEPLSAAPAKAAGLLGEMNAPPPPPPQEPAPENPEKAADLLTPPRLIRSVSPIYPLAARQAQIQGEVVIEIRIDASGNVAEMKVISGPQVLRAAATAAVAKWKYEPALLRGQPTVSSSRVTLSFHFR